MDQWEECEEWPPNAEEMYERVQALGRGSYGTVWMARRVVPPKNDDDDEYVAIKNIEIKQEKSYMYAKREISILTELHHPNVIRLIRAFDIWRENSQLVVLQLARGPNLQHLVYGRGALGLPLARLVSRHLIAAVSYLHGRAVIHRDIKPTNCILENTQHNPSKQYDWYDDSVIWSDGPEAEESVASGKWRLMLVDFGFARALEDRDLHDPKTHMAHSIVNESSVEKVATTSTTEDEEIEKFAAKFRTETEDPAAADADKKRLSAVSIPVHELSTVEEDAATNGSPKRKEKEPDSPRKSKRRSRFRRQSTARNAVRSMSALGTKAFAAPEIRYDLRTKTDEDINISREALTDCVADYGMIVDAYSVGWTLRVILTGVPPKYSLSKYMQKIAMEEQMEQAAACGCFCRTKEEKEPIRVRDFSQVPKDALHLISMLTEKNPDARMTVREAQNHAWIAGTSDEEPYVLLTGDIPSKHGDPVVPLNCAKSL